MMPSRADGASQSWLQSANCDGALGRWLLTALALLLLPCAGGQWARLWMRYEREGLYSGQLWRLLTAHFAHLDLHHALLNALALLLLWMLFARDLPPRRWLWIVFCSMTAIDAGLWFLRPQVEWYVGASGVLHGVFAAGAAASFRRARDAGGLMMLLLIAKLMYEQHSGHSAFDSAMPIVPDAHLFGVLGGLLGCWLPRPASKPL